MSNNFKINDIIICKMDFFIPGTGITFLYFKDRKYKIVELLTEWKELAWKIELIENNKFENTGWFTEKDLLKNFSNIKKERKEKLNMILKNYI